MKNSRRTHRSPYLLSVLLLWLLSDSNASKGTSSASRPVFGWRGGSLPNSSTDSTKNVTVEDYIAAMKEKDGHDRRDGDDEEDDLPSPSSDESNHPESTPEPDDGDSDDPAVVGVKSHSHHNKKSNAVGDPDGDDDDDSDDSLSECSEEWEELAEFDDFSMEDMVVEPELQVEVEVMEEEDDDDLSDSAVAKSTGGGGVGVRLSRMNNRRKSSKDPWRTKNTRMSTDQKHLLEAWMPHLYFAPTPSGIDYLTDNARLLEAASKSRLDRRTLYAGLLLEWGSANSTRSKSARKFLHTTTSQALQAALSMATQPQWRQSAPRTSGIRLYSEEENAKTLTLGMQETIAMALVSTIVCYRVWYHFCAISRFY
jgi:hypothetical protein